MAEMRGRIVVGDDGLPDLAMTLDREPSGLRGYLAGENDGPGGVALARSALPCPNRFCDGYGDIDVTPSMTGGSRAPNGCGVGPHPYPHPLSAGR